MEEFGGGKFDSYKYCFCRIKKLDLFGIKRKVLGIGFLRKMYCKLKEISWEFLDLCYRFCQENSKIILQLCCVLSYKIENINY